MTKTILPFKVEKTEESLTANSGLSLYLEMYKGLKLDRMATRFLPKPGSSKGYKAAIYLQTIVSTFIAGGKFIEDTRKIARDTALKELLNNQKVPSSDAIGDWLRRQPQDKIEGMNKLHRNLTKVFFKKQKNMTHTLDIDAFQIESAKESANITYKGNPGYMPMMGHLVESDWCIGHEFREGNDAPHARNLEFIKYCISMMPKGQEIKRVRIDAAGYQKDIIDYLDKSNIKFSITARKTANIKNEIDHIPEDAWQSIKGSDREFAESWASMDGLTGHFRIIVQRWINPKRDLFGKVPPISYHVICTNYTEKEKTALEVIKWHNGRCASENYYKEKKQGFNLNYCPCDHFQANAIWFSIGVLAYNLHIFAKTFLLPEDWRKKTIQTVRWQLIHIAGKVIRHAGVVILKLAGISQELLSIFNQARYRCRSYVFT